MLAPKGCRPSRLHSRSPEAEQCRKLYKDQRWCGPDGIKRQALSRNRYTCQRCECMVIEGNRTIRAANVNHKVPH